MKPSCPTSPQGCSITGRHRCPMPWIVWGFVVAMALMHQDFWNWSDRTLVLGFVPAGLAYHIGFSVMSAVIWLLASRYAWPTAIERWAEEGEDRP